MNNLDLPRPHGFLVWKQKQTAIGNDEPLEADTKLLLTSDGEAFGYVTLSQPAQMTVEQFEHERWWHKDDYSTHPKHCIRPQDRKMLWPDSELFYLHHIKSFLPFDQPLPFENGELKSHLPTKEEEIIIEQAEKLPKQITLISEAVVFEDGRHRIECQDNEELQKALSVILDGIKGIEDKELPLYSLALVRLPVMRFKKKQEGDDMPWEIRQDFDDCSGWAVVKIENDEIEGCHETEDEAQAQLAALNIAEEEASKADMREMLIEMLQAEELLGDEFSEEDLRDAIMTALFADEPEEVVEEDTEAMDDEEKQEDNEKAGRRLKTAMMKRLNEALDTIKELLSWAKYDDTKMYEGDVGFAIKEINGQPWLFTWSANAFKDREEEIFSTKSLEEWASKAEQSEDKGFFNFYHIPGTDFAKKEWVGVPGRILVEAGPFLDNEKGQAALKTLKQFADGHPEVAPEGWGCSIEYRYLPEERKTGVYENIEITRTSILPRFAAANIWTQVKEVKDMAMTDEQKEATLEFFGKELGGSLISGAEDKSAQLEENVDHKSSDDKDKKEDGKKATEEFTLDQVVDAVAEKMSLNLQPIAEAIAGLAESQQKLGDRVAGLEKTEKTTKANGMSKFMLNVVRASEAEDTKLSEEDDLKDKKPKESTQPSPDGTYAGAYFGSK